MWSILFLIIDSCTDYTAAGKDDFSWLIHEGKEEKDTFEEPLYDIVNVDFSLGHFPDKSFSSGQAKSAQQLAGASSVGRLLAAA